MKEHIVINGLVCKYKNWTCHGKAYISLHGNQDREGGNISMDLDMQKVLSETASKLFVT